MHCFSCLRLDGAECAHRYARKGCEEGIFWTEVVFLIKIFNFYQKNNFGLIDFLGAHLFLRSKKTVREKDAFIYFTSLRKKRFYAFMNAQ